MYHVTLEKILQEMELVNLTPDIDLSNRLISHGETNRPALQLAGFYKHFDAERVQIIGKVEHAYLEGLEENERKKVIKTLFTYDLPCIIITRDQEPYPEMIEYANDFKVPLLQSKKSTSYFNAELIRLLKFELAPRISIHGVLVDIYGEGILIMGESGIGKSETALELVKRGHRLVADDVVEIKKISDKELIGTSPEVIRHFIELRGIGIIDVKELFGVESVKEVQSIDLVVKLELWRDDKEYDRLGLNEEYIEILGNKVVCHSIPIRPGRNIAIIAESAAINHRQKNMGYNAAKELNKRVMGNIKRRKDNQENSGGK
ncbi:HPr(Ser) kinase/phosphatase [Vallitalea okinawensis]|uniref:HPr(Ser) kinase/phosphatase n=1 Tax=Vallitalea okinawensis TaxID=2078660 RepID=UPI000CFCC946|nr:HPr(Ser) kinase/phosphatase [Vallitalea okinawensis]